MPVFRLIAKTAAYRIVVDVINLLVHRGRLDDIAIIAAAALPKTVVDVTIGLAILHPWQKVWCLTPYVEQRSLGHRLLEGVEESTDVYSNSVGQISK